MNPKPFIKWVGGKSSISDFLIQLFPNDCENYYEPFVGGGSLFFKQSFKQCSISDINSNLITTYQVVKDNPKALIKKLEEYQLQHCKEAFLKQREALWKEENPINIAAIFIYLNKTCFNGLYRVNKSGKFNVPMGNYKKCKIYDEQNILDCSKYLQNCTIENKSYFMTEINKDAFYYFDPPYHKTYSQYDKKGFNEKDHENLRDFCNKINEVGGKFIVSNSDTLLIRDLYKEYKISTILAKRSVSSDGNGRQKATELVIKNY